jgi:hypothetical protein
VSKNIQKYMKKYMKKPLIKRLICSLVIGLISGFCCFLIRWNFYGGAGDFSWAIMAARDISNGTNPYGYQYSDIEVPYPLTVALIGFPFTFFQQEIAAGIFFGLSSFILAYGLMKDGDFWRLQLFFSPSFFYAMAFVQWTPLIVAMIFFPLFIFMIVIKPHIALPLAFSGLTRFKKQHLLIAIAILFGSLILMPNWPLEYIKLLKPYQGIFPILVYSAGGPLLLLSLLKWRDPRGKLLLLMSLIPQRMFYDQLPLWVLPTSSKEMLVLNFTGWLGFYLFFFHFRSGWNWPFWVVLFIYIPSLILLIRKEMMELIINRIIIKPN